MKAIVDEHNVLERLRNAAEHLASSEDPLSQRTKDAGVEVMPLLPTDFAPFGAKVVARFERIQRSLEKSPHPASLAGDIFNLYADVAEASAPS